MNKFAKALTCAALGSAMLFSVACNKGEQTDITESRWLALSLGVPDGVFNPFFSTSLVDSKVISMTQASLITSDVDSKGDVVPVAGEEYPTVAKAFEIKYYNGDNECEPAQAAEDGGRTEYRFLIKNGMKFSDGEPLTIKDVLFNFYVYLDPVYTGSNTMYSVNIQGLDAYRNNNHYTPDGSGDSNLGADQARQRIQKLIDYANSANGVTSLDEEGEKDFEYVKTKFKEELETDWNNMASSWQETYKVNYTFQYTWQAYLFQEGIVTAQKKQYPQEEGKYITKEVRVDENGQEIDPTVEANKEAYKSGKVKTTLDKWVEGNTENGSTEQIGAQFEGLTDEDAIKQKAIDIVYGKILGDKTGLDEVLSYWATANTVYSDWVAEERGELLEKTDAPQYFIKGIQTEKVTEFDLDGKNGPDQLDGTYDVLKIIVNRVDPAAIWQFGITIAPLHYYSGEYGGKDYVKDFNGDTAITDYSGDGDLNGDKQDNDICFGVKRGDFDFFQTILKGDVKSGVPVGAGPYKASTELGGKPERRSQFFNNNLVNYERNENFTTMGEQIDNAKIRYMRYKVVDESRILNSVISGEIDYGEPNGTETNRTIVDNNANVLGSTHYSTNGFGYVGVNPTYVPDLNIRRIIMRAMDTALSVDYYGKLADNLYRPMSKTSWAYPEDAQDYFKDDPLGTPEQVKQELRKLGYQEGDDGVFYKDNDKLKYTFTIAGANADHPAYNMFNQAADTLNQCGFDISVSTDPNALLKLTSGELAVWAAAWSSGVDPDMYQVYHKDSQASSTLNWGYKTIYNDTTGKYDTEKGIIDEMSKRIMDARKVTDNEDRAPIYYECLDMLMELAVELPVYQRDDFCVYNKTVINPASLNQKPNATIGLIDRIWEVNYN